MFKSSPTYTCLVLETIYGRGLLTDDVTAPGAVAMTTALTHRDTPPSNWSYFNYFNFVTTYYVYDLD